jgi:hypothetical protein
LGPCGAQQSFLSSCKDFGGSLGPGPSSTWVHYRPSPSKLEFVQERNHIPPGLRMGPHAGRKILFPYHGGTCTGAPVLEMWPVDVAAMTWGVRLFSVAFAVWFARKDLTTVDREKNVCASPLKETPRWLRLALTPRFESPWLRKTWALYFAGVYVPLLSMNFEIAWKREACWLGELICSLWG